METKMQVKAKAISKITRVHAGYVHNFADDYLTTLYFLLKQAQKNNKDIGVFTYTLPIIIISVCFLESNINDIIASIERSSNQDLIKNICNDFVQLDKTSLLEKYYIVLKYCRNIDIKRDKNKYFSKVFTIIDLRNLLVHDKSYVVISTLKEKDKIVQLLEKQKWLKPNHNLKGIVPEWLQYLEYNNICIMLKIIFEFYLQFSKFLNSNEEPIYQNKIERIISWHPLMQNLEELKK